MLQFNGLELTYLECGLVAITLLLTLVSVVAMRRIGRLESRLLQVQLTAQREIKMVNQGAIGIGRRCAQIEKNLKKPANVASFDAVKHAKTAARSFESVAEAANIPLKAEKPKFSSGLSTRAEQALSAWINNHKTA